MQPEATAPLEAPLATAEAAPEIGVHPVAGRIGAEVVGLDLNQPLSQPIIREIRQALVKYKVIFFRGQQLTAEGQIAFARQFGNLTAAHPLL
ncbi:MAG TPA: TauD/TfdA family dioxygenase, partial [Allocoleopsis sp.]